MLHPVAQKGFRAAIVPLNDQLNCDLPRWCNENLFYTGIQLEDIKSLRRHAYLLSKADRFFRIAVR
jgi:hypothetical protein